MEIAVIQNKIYEIRGVKVMPGRMGGFKIPKWNHKERQRGTCTVFKA